MGPIVKLCRCAIAILDRTPYSLLAIVLRAALIPVFWNSAITKLKDWPAAVSLFSSDFMLPSILPPEPVAVLATGVELATSVMLLLGLGTRGAAAVLLGMTAFIEIFVFPEAWPIHIQWAAMLLVLLCRGAGRVSLDYPIARWLAANNP